MPSSSYKTLAVITARGGSKGLPGKNIMRVGDKPLIAWTIESALRSSSIDKVILSSDDDEIMECAKAWGCDVPFRRPVELASDTASSIDVINHALEQFPGYEYVVLLQPTSPLRTQDDIDQAFSLMISSGALCCVSVCQAEQSPYWMFNLKADCRLDPLIPQENQFARRQDLPPVYVLNGAIYIGQVDWIKKAKSFLCDNTVAYKMPVERSLDIDTLSDFEKFKSIIEA